MQRGAIVLEKAMISVEFPPPESEVLPGTPWGSIDAFPTPAYWAYQVYARRLQGNRINYKLGTTLKEEVGACLLGGHGIPANVGLAAFEHLRALGAFTGEPPSEVTLLQWLQSPLEIEGRRVHYRFAKQKSRFLAAALLRLEMEIAPTQSGKELRNWLLAIPGIGYKTASWVARNWLDADDVAILDIHILRAGMLGRFLQPDLTVERHYLELEEQFLKFSMGLGVRASELDALIWLEMMSSPDTVHSILNLTSSSATRSGKRRPLKKATPQLALLG